MVRTFISAEVFLFRSPAGTSPTLLLEDLQQVWACKSQMGFLGCRCGTATRSPLPPWPDRSVSLHSQKCSSSFFSAYYSSLWGQYLKQRIHATLMWYFQIPKCLWGWIPKRYAVLPLKDMLFSSPLVLANVTFFGNVIFSVQSRGRHSDGLKSPVAREVISHQVCCSQKQRMPRTDGGSEKLKGGPGADSAQNRQRLPGSANTLVLDFWCPHRQTWSSRCLTPPALGCFIWRPLS